MNLRSAVTALALAAMPAVLVAQTSITVPPSGLGYYQWGLNTEAESVWGQTFTAPSAPNTRLTDITFFLRDYTVKPSIFFQLFVYAWSGTARTGDALFSSSVLSAPSGLTSYAPNTVAVGGLDLSAGSSYLWYAQAVSGTGSYLWDSPNPWDSYVGGTLVYSADNAATWSSYVPGLQGGPDFAFTANFDNPTVTPEPATMVLLATGLFGVVGAGLLRRRNAGADAN